jgi:hypothetical protein
MIIEYLFLNSILVLIGYFSLNYWAKKRNVSKPFYYSLIIIAIMLTILNLTSLIPVIYINWHILSLYLSYIINAFIGAFLINKLFKLEFIPSLRFTSWYLFLITTGWYLILISLIIVLAGITSIF